jgi:hypothetical protein
LRRARSAAITGGSASCLDRRAGLGGDGFRPTDERRYTQDPVMATLRP